MIPTFNELTGRIEEYALLQEVRNHAESVLAEVGSDFTLFQKYQHRIDNDAVHIYAEALHSLRSWLITFEIAASHFLVQVNLDPQEWRWEEVLLRWERHAEGLYYIKNASSAKGPQAEQGFPIWSNSLYYMAQGEPIGKAFLVGHINEPKSRNVYWLFDREIQAGSRVHRRQISGVYQLDGRQFHPLSPLATITWNNNQGEERI